MVCNCIRVFEVFDLRKQWRNVARFCLPALKSLLSHPAFCRRRGLRQQWAHKVCCCEGSRQLAPSTGKIVIREKRWARQEGVGLLSTSNLFSSMQLVTTWVERNFGRAPGKSCTIQEIDELRARWRGEWHFWLPFICQYQVLYPLQWGENPGRKLLCYQKRIFANWSWCCVTPSGVKRCQALPDVLRVKLSVPINRRCTLWRWKCCAPQFPLGVENWQGTQEVP